MGTEDILRQADRPRHCWTMGWGNHCVVSGKFFFDSIADNGPTQWAETLGTGLGPTSDWLIVPGWDRAETGHPAELAQKSGQTQKAPLNKDRLHKASCQVWGN